MIRKTVPVLLILGLLASTTAFAADWPNFLGPTLDGKAPDVEINKDWGNNPPAELWRVSLTDAGYAGPSVADGKVFIIDHRGAEDVVRALALDTGDTVWEYAYPDPGGANNGFARATPCVDEGRVFVAGRAGQIVALNAEDGAEIWSRNIQQDFNGKRPQWNYTASPIVHGEKLIVVPGGPNAAVAALNKTTGETIWAGGGSFGPGYAQPAIATINGTEQYVCFMWEALAGVNAESGELLWQVPWETKYGVNAAVPIVEGNYVFATSDYGYGGGVYEITAAGAQQVWGSKVMRAHFSTPIYHNDFIYGTTEPGDLICLGPRDGSEMWRQGGFEKGGIVLVDGVIIGLDGRGGDLVMVEAASGAYNELGRIKPLGGQSWTAPIVADGKILVRNTTALVCLDLM